jgi:ribosomal protein L11 methyltransferase
MTKKPQPNSEPSWFEIAIPAHAARVDLLTGALAELGVRGTEVREPRPDAAEIVFYLQADSASAAAESATALARRHAELADADVIVRGALASEVWTENWRSHFAPVCIGRRLAVVPPWQPAAYPDRLTLVINPGGAFGTGRHETTWLCLEALEEHVRPGLRVADVGTGSGILAVTAAKLGAEKVLAIDVDPAAVDATRENAAANGVATRIDAMEAAVPPSDGVPYDVVVANIYADTLIALCATLDEMTAERGVLVLSGIEATRSGEVEAAFAQRGFGLAEKRVRGEWAALVFRRPTA